MKWNSITTKEAKSFYEEYLANDKVECPNDYKEIRSELIELFEKSTQEANAMGDLKKKAYNLDLLYGLKLYSLLSNKYRMTNREASDYGIWRFLSTRVVPDLVDKRYGKEHSDRYWKKPRRIWLWSIWFYIYLSWQGNEKDTYKILKDNTTDTILQLVDRAGKEGYRIDLTRIMMLKFYLCRKNRKLSEKKSSELFRKVMVLNTARLMVLEPAVTDGGTDGYVDGLFNYFNEGN